MLVLALAALAVTFTLHPGQVRTLQHAHPGDSVVCRGASDSIRATIKAPMPGATTFTNVWDRKLTLTLAPIKTGGVRASCLRR